VTGATQNLGSIFMIGAVPWILLLLVLKIFRAFRFCPSRTVVRAAVSGVLAVIFRE